MHGPHHRVRRPPARTLRRSGADPRGPIPRAAAARARRADASGVDRRLPLPGRRRSGQEAPMSSSTALVEPEPTGPDPPVRGRGQDLPHLGLQVIRVGPALMLIVVVAGAASLSPVFLTTRNLGNVLAQTAVIAVLAHGPTARHRHPGHRPVGRLDDGAGRGRRCADLRGRAIRAAGGAGMLGCGMAVGAVNGAGLCLGAASPPVHRHAGHVEHRARARAVAGRRPAATRHAGDHPDGRRRLDRLAAVLDAARRRRSPSPCCC